MHALPIIKQCKTLMGSRGYPHKIGLIFCIVDIFYIYAIILLHYRRQKMQTLGILLQVISTLFIVFAIISLILGAMNGLFALLEDHLLPDEKAQRLFIGVLCTVLLFFLWKFYTMR